MTLADFTSRDTTRIATINSNTTKTHKFQTIKINTAVFEATDTTMRLPNESQKDIATGFETRDKTEQSVSSTIIIPTRQQCSSIRPFTSVTVTPFHTTGAPIKSLAATRASVHFFAKPANVAVVSTILGIIGIVAASVIAYLLSSRPGTKFSFYPR